MIDLVLVEYEDHSKEVLMAPYTAVKQGDCIQTDWGWGKVLQVVSTLKDDDVLGIFDAAHPLHPVLAKLVEIEHV